MAETDLVVKLLREIKAQLQANRQPAPPSVPLHIRERAVKDSVDYILGAQPLASALVVNNKRDTIAAGLRATSIQGTVAEFGVYKGTSLTQIAQYFDTMTVHGFDSFVGLPESWSGSPQAAGDFGIGGTPPDIPVDNVEFHVGLFDETVPKFATEAAGPFAFCHLDADLYSSTKTVMDTLFDWFVPGTVLVFDEYFGYHGWRNHEHKAFMELLERSGLSYEGLSIGHMNLAVKLIEAR
jgi:hypothetical protein